MNHYPIAISDTGGLDFPKLGKEVIATAPFTLGAGAMGALIGGKKHRLLGAAIGAIGTFMFLKAGAVR